MKRAHGICLVCTWLAATTSWVAGHSFYASHIPNGGNVNCTEEMEGCTVGDICRGLGHNTCAGGSLPLNPFGVDFQEADRTWTEELCQMDSDGDGLTNGQELGDPCCIWTAMSEGILDEDFVPSHPGYAFSVPPANITCEDVEE